MIEKRANRNHAKTVSQAKETKETKECVTQLGDKKVCHIIKWQNIVSPNLVEKRVA